MAVTLAIFRNRSLAGIEKSDAEAIAEEIVKKQDDTASKDFVRSEISSAKFQLICWIVGTGIALVAAIKWIP